MQNITIENNTVNGDPAGNRSVSADGSDTRDVLASPLLELWNWPDGTVIQSFDDTRLAEFYMYIASSELEEVQQVRSVTDISCGTTRRQRNASCKTLWHVD